jgi:NAD(P)-dependent dehydrogenase (short-subunit alcohol dehydrogenase family)
MSGKVLIYGRGGGIGSFVASSLAQNGDGLHFTGRDEHKLKAVTEMSKSLTEATSIVDLNLVIPYWFREGTLSEVDGAVRCERGCRLSEAIGDLVPIWSAPEAGVIKALVEL